MLLEVTGLSASRTSCLNFTKKPLSVRRLLKASATLLTRSSAIIEGGPPQELVASFHKLFDEKIKDTETLAEEAAERYGLLPGYIVDQRSRDNVRQC